MRMFSLSLLLVAAACVIGAGEQPATLQPAEQEPAAVGADAAPLTLSEAAKAWVDFSGKGTVDVLNNGLIVVRTPAVFVTDAKGKVQFKKMSDSVVFQTENARDVQGELFAVLSFQDVDFAITWGSEREGVDGVISCNSAEKDLGSQIEFAEASPMILYGSSCSADCKDGKCNITCPSDKAALCYCSGGLPVCQCQDKPKGS